jgi:SAM-dependent methyltransferase
MKVADAVAFGGHQVHVCRYREAHTLLRWLGADLRGLRVLDVAGGDGYWAAQARRRGAWAVALDIADSKLRWGHQLAAPAALVRGDALELPFADASFDRVMSICAIEHFDDGARSLDEMTRVLAPGGELVMSADTLTLAQRWPRLYRAAGRAWLRCDRASVPVQDPVGAAAVPGPFRLRRQGRVQRGGAADAAGRRVGPRGARRRRRHRADPRPAPSPALPACGWAGWNCSSGAQRRA